MMVGSKVIFLQNYILKKSVEGVILADNEYLHEDIPWTLPAGTLVVVSQTQYYWIIEKTSNLLPGTLFNVKFKAVIPKNS